MKLKLLILSTALLITITSCKKDKEGNPDGVGSISALSVSQGSLSDTLLVGSSLKMAWTATVINASKADSSITIIAKGPDDFKREIYLKKVTGPGTYELKESENYAKIKTGPTALDLYSTIPIGDNTKWGEGEVTISTYSNENITGTYYIHGYNKNGSYAGVHSGNFVINF